MKLVVLQPSYLPWLGYFEQLAMSDVFVHYDDVQFDKHGWRNRNRIRTPGEPGWSWLTVPVRIGGRFGARVDEVEIDAQVPWARKHWRTMQQHYGRAPHWSRYAERFEELYARRWTVMADLALASTDLLAELLGIEHRCVRSSGLSTSPPADDRTERLVALCAHLGATEYYSGAAARDYLDVAKFEEAGIAVEFQDYAHPHYRQCYPGFVSHLSAVDLLFNVGPESLDVVLGRDS